MAEPFTYHDDGGDDLEPAAREVVCRYYLEAGTQHTEFVTQFLGPVSYTHLTLPTKA